MPTIQRINRPSITDANLGPGPKPADIKLAKSLKETLSKITDFGPPLAHEASPKRNSKDQWHAPNGNPLIPVMLSLPNGTSKEMSSIGFVDPKTNLLYRGQFLGTCTENVRTGNGEVKQFFRGPVALPPGTQFTGKTFPPGDVKALTKAASGPVKADKAAWTKMLDAYQYQIEWNGQRVPGKSTFLKQDMLGCDDGGNPLPDSTGYSYYAIGHSSDPNKVVFMRMSGPHKKYSQPIDLRFGLLPPPT